jgi:hypothetical protein
MQLLANLKLSYTKCSKAVIPNTASLKSEMNAVFLPCDLVLIL